jgi:hypothetical protein
MKYCRNHGLRVKRRVGRLLALTMLSGLCAFGQSEAAFAQAGSVGGTIGKQDKSISGGDDTADSRHAVPGIKHPGSAGSKRTEQKGAGSACGRVAGVWTANGWYNAIYGRGDVVLSADGSARHVSGIVGVWTCVGGHFVMHWKNWAHGEGSLSNDGNTVTFADGGTMTRGK